MPEAVLIFTFSPVQPFIAEARRAADLYAGSRILVNLATAAAAAVEAGGGKLVYPATVAGDVPNKLVAVVPADRAKAIAEAAEAKLRERWAKTVSTARDRLAGLEPKPDATWEAIWARQAPGPWEVYWAAAPMDADGGAAYAAAYRRADRTLAAAKRTRTFLQAEEPGLKDSLSGARSALRTEALDARDYWAVIAALPSVTAAKLRPEGRERLDTLGAVKRFGAEGDTPFLSTSSVASSDFLARARERAPAALRAYRQAVETVLGDHAYRSRPDADWPYDGDLFYPETLRPTALADRYGRTSLTEATLTPVREALHALHKAAGGPPSPYYGIVVLDGDDMGKRIADCLRDPDPRGKHTALSERLATFAGAVGTVTEGHHAAVIYNGGDDVLLLAPLAAALPVTRALAERFRETTGGTASAGIAVVHHLSPLDAALAATRAAEERAKWVPGKAAVCLRVLKRSGETAELRCRWDGLGTTVTDLVHLFTETDGRQPLASRFPYAVANAAYAVPDPGVMFTAELRRLLGRHRDRSHRDAPDPETWAARLNAWAAGLPAVGGVSATEHLARWLIFARFVAQGGGE
jgi:CRISPR-associated protein Cmr2